MSYSIENNMNTPVVESNVMEMDLDTNMNLDTNTDEYLEGISFVSYSISLPPNITVRKCSFCHTQGHSILRCTKANEYGQTLHLTAMNMRDIDIENNMSGFHIKHWIMDLSKIQLRVLAQRIHLDAYAHELWNRGVISVNEDYRKLFYHFYYLEIIRKHRIRTHFCVETVTQDAVYECPACLESELPHSEMLSFNCHHSVCKECFEKYINALDTKKKLVCWMCRAEITDVSFANSEYQAEFKQKYFL